MALIIGKKNTRIIQVEAKEPLDNDKVIVHKFDIEIEIVPRDIWKAMSDRWEELATRLRNEEVAFRMGRDIDDKMSDEEIKEAREPIYRVAAPYIKNIGPLLDENKQPIEFTEAIKDAILEEPWLQQPIADAFMAVQRGLTMADYKKAKTKN